jgi:hypothetical protein
MPVLFVPAFILYKTKENYTPSVNYAFTKPLAFSITSLAIPAGAS